MVEALRATAATDVPSPSPLFEEKLRDWGYLDIHASRYKGPPMSCAR